jgi:hypothetical protein
MTKQAIKIRGEVPCSGHGFDVRMNLATMLSSFRAWLKPGVADGL